MTTKDPTRYPGESALDFANRRLKLKGRTDVRWSMVRGQMVLRDVVDKQGRFNV